MSACRHSLVWKATLPLPELVTEEAQLSGGCWAVTCPSSDLLPFKTIWGQGGDLPSPSTLWPHTFSKEMFSSRTGEKNLLRKVEKTFSVFSAFPCLILHKKVFVASVNRASVSPLGFNIFLTTSSCYCEMRLPEVAFLFCPGSNSPQNPWVRVLVREEGRKRWLESFMGSFFWPTQSSLLNPGPGGGRCGEPTSGSGRPKLLTWPPEDRTYTGQKNMGPFLFQNFTPPFFFSSSYFFFWVNNPREKEKM